MCLFAQAAQTYIERKEETLGIVAFLAMFP